MFITKEKTNWIYILILVLAVFTAQAAILSLSKNQDFEYLQKAEIKIQHKNIAENPASSLSENSDSDSTDIIIEATNTETEITAEPEVKPAVKIDRYEAFAKCLSSKGVKMYGASWCGHCINQKNMFGQNWQYINYIECAQGAGHAPVCQEARIQGYPTWIFQDETRIPGELTFEQISQYSGCGLE